MATVRWSTKSERMSKLAYLQTRKLALCCRKSIRISDRERDRMWGIVGLQAEEKAL